MAEYLLKIPHTTKGGNNCSSCKFSKEVYSPPVSHYCILNNYDISTNCHEHTVSADCPLVELPPHGRLGDLDKLYEVATAPYGNFYGFEALIRDIKNAPTVIEASCENS